MRPEIGRPLVHAETTRSSPSRSAHSQGIVATRPDQPVSRAGDKALDHGDVVWGDVVLQRRRFVGVQQASSGGAERAVGVPMHVRPLALLSLAFSAACGSTGSPDVEQSADELARAHDDCTPESQSAIEDEMRVQPILPPRRVAGLDLAGGDDWPGLVKSEVERRFCPGVAHATLPEHPESIGFPQANGPFVGKFDKESHKLVSWHLYYPYEGYLSFRSRPGSPFGNHSYMLKIGMPVLRNGRVYPIPWNDAPALERYVTELHDALVYRYAPELPPEQTSCRASGRCLISTIGDTAGIIGIRDVRFYFVVSDKNHAEHGSTPSEFYGFVGPAALPPPPAPPSPRALQDNATLPM
jgi:hypothetical protein